MSHQVSRQNANASVTASSSQRNLRKRHLRVISRMPHGRVSLVNASDGVLKIGRSPNVVIEDEVPSIFQMDIAHANDALTSRFQAASLHAVPDPSEVNMNVEFPDTVRYLLDHWYARRLHGDVPRALKKLDHDSERHGSSSTSDIIPVIDAMYLNLQPTAAEHRRMLRYEMARLMAQHHPQRQPLTWQEWEDLASQDRSRPYPCLCAYLGTEIFVIGFLRQLLAVHPLRDDRALSVRVQMDRAMNLALQNVPVFTRIARYRAAVDAHKNWARVAYNLWPTNLWYAAEPLRPLLQSACVRAPPLVEEGKGGIPEAVHAARDTLVQLLTSRLIKQVMFTDMADGSLAELCQRLLLNPRALMDRPVIVGAFRQELHRQNLLLHGDDDDSIITMAHYYACRSSPLVEGHEAYLDTNRVLDEALGRVNRLRDRWRMGVVNPLTQAVSSYWTESVDHKEERNVARRCVMVVQHVKLKAAQLGPPSFRDSPPQELSLRWRALDSVTVWWHKTHAQRRACGCARSQSEYLKCMLNALFQHALRHVPNASFTE